MDAVPGLPLPRLKASFLPLVPRLPRGAWGAGLEGGVMGATSPCRLQQGPARLGWGHKGRSWQPRTTDSSSEGPPPHLTLVLQVGTLLRTCVSRG